MNLMEVADIFISTVDGLMSTRLSGSKVIYVETKDGRYINFRPNAFKKRLQDVVGLGTDVAKLLDYFRRLGWLVVDAEDRFTNIQWIQRKSRRVITIHWKVYETLKELVLVSVIGGEKK